MTGHIKKSPNKKESHLNVNIYSVVEAVNAAIEPGEEKLIPWIVKHIIETRNADARG